MFKGYLIEIDSKKHSIRDHTRFSHMLYGRAVSYSYRKRTKNYYKKGMLHNTIFTRMQKGKIVVEDIASIDFDKLREYGDIKVLGEIELNENEHILTTGKQYWMTKYEERGKTLNVSKENR